LWHVKPEITDIKHIEETGGIIPRSKTSLPFPMHTDCSFRNPPPKYIALLVVEEDHHGGGDIIIASANDVLRELSSTTQDILRHKEFLCKIPPEFRQKDKELERITILLDGRVQYRREIIVVGKNATEEMDALNELDSALSNKWNIWSLNLRKNDLLLLDNGLFFSQ